MPVIAAILLRTYLFSRSTGYPPLPFLPFLSFPLSLSQSRRYPFSLMEETVDASLQPNVLRTLRSIKTNRQWFTGKAYGYTNPSVLWKQGKVLQEWLRAARTAMDRVGYLDLMTNDATDTRNATVEQIATHMRPPPRSIVHKHCLLSDVLDCSAVEEARVIWVENNGTAAGGGGGGEEQAGPRNATAVVVLADPVVAPATLSRDIDPKATVAAVLESAKKRKYFWVFLDHLMTAGALETTLDLLTAASGSGGANDVKIELVTIDELLRVFLRDNVQ